MSLHAKTDFKCTLKDKNEKELFSFKATASSDLVLSADFVGGGVASGGQAFTVSTEREFRLPAVCALCRSPRQTIHFAIRANIFPQAARRGRTHEKNIYSGVAMI